MIASAGVTELSTPRWVVWMFALAILLTYFGLLAHFPLSEPDEPRYAEIAREMVELGDWVTPHLNYVKYFEKPPLIYWLTAINLALFGNSELVVRLWPAFFGMLGIAMAYAIGRSIYGEWTGQAAAALLAASPLYFGLSQFVILDMPLSALIAVALASFWFAYCEASRRPRFVLLLYVATALAVLTKGPVAVLLTGGTIIAFLLLRADLRALRWLVSPLGILLFLLIAMPWFVLVSRRNPEFIDFFVFKQHVSRYLTPDEHRQPVWFFVPIVLGGMLPWTAFALLAPRLVRSLVVRVMRRRVSAGTLFCVVWCAVVFGFFSASGSKLGTYILPMCCPLSILMARFVRQVIVQARVDLVTHICIGLLVFAAVAIVGALVTGEIVDDWRVALILPRVAVGGAIFAAAVAAALGLTRRHGAQPGIAALVLATLALQAVAITGRSVASQYRPLGRIVRRQAAAQDQIILYQHYTQGITFYGRRRVVMVGGRGELDFGSRQGDQRDFFWDSDVQLIDAWGAPRHIFLIINRSELEPLRSRLQPPPRHIASFGKKVIVVNFPG